MKGVELATREEASLNDAHRPELARALFIDGRKFGAEALGINTVAGIRDGMGKI